MKQDIPVSEFLSEEHMISNPVGIDMITERISEDPERVDKFNHIMSIIANRHNPTEDKVKLNSLYNFFESIAEELLEEQ
jgi:hypothetical protein